MFSKLFPCPKQKELEKEKALAAKNAGTVDAGNVAMKQAVEIRSAPPIYQEAAKQ